MHRDVAGAQPGQQRRVRPADPGGAGDAGRGQRRRARVELHAPGRSRSSAPRTVIAPARQAARGRAATSSSSRAWASAVSESASPASIRDSSRSRASSSRTVTPRAGHRAVAGLLDQDVPVGERRHLRQVGDHQHLGGPGQPRQPPADLDRGARRRRRRRPRRRRTSAPGWCRPAPPRAPASPGTARRRRRPCAAAGAREPVLAASRISTSSTPRRVPQPALADPERAAARRGRSRRLGVVLGDRDLEPGVRHRQQRQLGGDLGGEPAGGLGRGRRTASAATSASSARSDCCSARSASIRSSVPSRSSSRVAEASAQASTSSTVSPYLRVSAVSAARRSETAASRAGSVSTAAA